MLQEMPLAAKLRPASLDQFVGQEHLVGPGKPLRIMAERQSITSIIFWGPPGLGKTTLARLLAGSDRVFHELSAVSAGKADIKALISSLPDRKAMSLPMAQTKTPVLFIDEIHRFNKAQQDFLLPYVEDGTLIIIGATTENPSFEVIPALLSRAKVFTLRPLEKESIKRIITNTLDYLRQEALFTKKVDQRTIEWLIDFSWGDARKIISLIEDVVESYGDITIETLRATAQTNQRGYDKQGDSHYDTISAFIKSMRASSPDAALYYLARMVDAGEDPKFIARRMVIFASEDIGLAVPTALVVANEVFRACETIGYPECQINLAHGVAYLATCKKDRSAYDAYFAALADVQQHGNLAIPLSLRNAPTALMKNFGYGKNYEMYPDKTASLLPEKLTGKRYLK